MHEICVININLQSQNIVSPEFYTDVVSIDH